MIGCVGDDADGRRIRESLAAAGIGVDGLSASREAATGTALIMVDAQDSLPGRAEVEAFLRSLGGSR